MKLRPPRRVGRGERTDLFAESSERDSRRRKPPPSRQHALKRRPDPQGQKSFRPSFSCNSLHPWTTRSPRPTRTSDGKPRRRLLMISKRGQAVEVVGVHGESPDFWSATSTGHATNGRGSRGLNGSEPSPLSLPKQKYLKNFPCNSVLDPSIVNSQVRLSRSYSPPRTVGSKVFLSETDCHGVRKRPRVRLGVDSPRRVA